MSKEPDRVEGQDGPSREDSEALAGEELGRRLRHLAWPVAPPEVKDRGLAVLLARQASLASAERPQRD
jgi:hypothetical protein